MTTETQDKPVGANRNCSPLPGNGLTCNEGTSIPEILEKLEEIFSNDKEDNSIADATKLLGEELKELDKEYKGIDDLVSKYKDKHNEWSCKSYGVAECQKQDIEEWWKKGIDHTVKCEIDKIWKRYWEVDAGEKTRECNWVKARYGFTELHSCWEQAKSKEGEAGEDFKEIKGFQDTVEKRFKDMDELYKRARDHYESEQFNAVYAVYLVYCKVFDDLGSFTKWSDRYAQCKPSGCPESQNEEDKKGFKSLNEHWFREKLVEYLRLFIKAKHARYTWHKHWLQMKSDADKKKEISDNFNSNRRQRFIQEAQEVQEPAPQQPQNTAQVA